MLQLQTLLQKQSHLQRVLSLLRWLLRQSLLSFQRSSQHRGNSRCVGCHIYVASCTLGSGGHAGLFPRNETWFFRLIFQPGDVIKFLNEPMFVDEYHDTSWTRGQYPAAPPCIFDSAERPVFYLVSNVGCKKTTTCEQWLFLKSGVLQVLFIFGFCITFLFRSYPHNKSQKCLCQQYFYKKHK